jgi:hypothetical protein
MVARRRNRTRLFALTDLLCSGLEMEADVALTMFGICRYGAID